MRRLTEASFKLCAYTVPRFAVQYKAGKLKLYLDARTVFTVPGTVHAPNEHRLFRRYTTAESHGFGNELKTNSDLSSLAQTA